MCKTPRCPHDAEDNPPRFLTRNLFGPKGQVLVEGYCPACAATRVQQAWTMMFLLIAIACGLGWLLR